ncbi:MAG: hypothetical protein KAR42_11135, partial [candidate division Zixibacteria bacterium]|nr:hypothetical protein [candidate division Zixibacteria bacterium]
MSQIELKIPTDNPSALRRFGEALDGMATDLDGLNIKKSVSDITTTIRPVPLTAAERGWDSTRTQCNEETLVAGSVLFYAADQLTAESKEFDNESNMNAWIKEGKDSIRTQCTAETFDELNRGTQYKQLAEDVAQTPPPGPVNSHLDSAGLPWDARIHSKNKSTVKNGTWRPKRMDANMDADQWDAYVTEVKAELMQALSGEPIVDAPPRDCFFAYLADTPPPPATG